MIERTILVSADEELARALNPPHDTEEYRHFASATAAVASVRTLATDPNTLIIIDQILDDIDGAMFMETASAPEANGDDDAHARFVLISAISAEYGVHIAGTDHIICRTSVAEIASHVRRIRESLTYKTALPLLLCAHEIKPRRATRHFVEQWQRLKLLLDDSEEGAAICDNEGRVLYANRSIARLLCAARARLLGDSLDRYVAPYDSPELLSAIASGFGGGYAMTTGGENFLSYRVESSERFRRLFVQDVGNEIEAEGATDLAASLVNDVPVLLARVAKSGASDEQRRRAITTFFRDRTGIEARTEEISWRPTGDAVEAGAYLEWIENGALGVHIGDSFIACALTRETIVADAPPASSHALVVATLDSLVRFDELFSPDVA